MEVRKTDEYESWFKKLHDLKAKAVINIRLKRIETTGNLGDYKVIDGGISELRIFYGPGYRIYFENRGNEIVLLLNAGDKSSQVRDIDRAKKLRDEYDKGDGHNEKVN